MSAQKVWTVNAGSFTRHYKTEQKAETAAMMLRAQGLLADITCGWIKADALTRLVIS